MSVVANADRSEPSSKSGPCAAATIVESLGKTARQMSHSVGRSSIQTSQHQMVVIGHEAVAMYLEGILLRCLHGDREK